MGRSLNPRWGSGIWLGRRWGTALRVVAVSRSEVREARAVARHRLAERWSREELQNFGWPRAWRAGSE
eukprot:7805089-Alexandrium_andersonii.AAC.1